VYEPKPFKMSSIKPGYPAVFGNVPKIQDRSEGGTINSRSVIILCIFLIIMAVFGIYLFAFY